MLRVGKFLIHLCDVCRLEKMRVSMGYFQDSCLCISYFSFYVFHCILFNMFRNHNCAWVLNPNFFVQNLQEIYFYGHMSRTPSLGPHHVPCVRLLQWTFNCQLSCQQKSPPSYSYYLNFLTINCREELSRCKCLLFFSRRWSIMDY